MTDDRKAQMQHIAALLDERRKIETWLAALDALRRRHPAVADVVLQALRNDPSPMMRERVATLLR